MLYEQFGRIGNSPPKSVESLAASIHSMLMGAIISGLIDASPGGLDRQRVLLLKNVQQLLCPTPKRKSTLD